MRILQNPSEGFKRGRVEGSRNSARIEGVCVWSYLCGIVRPRCCHFSFHNIRFNFFFFFFSLMHKNYL